VSYSVTYLAEAKAIIDLLDPEVIEKMAAGLAALREREGRLFLLGVGGGAGHASHAVNDFRKIAGIEAYSPCDNVSELTARTNDEGWDTSYSAWLRPAGSAKTTPCSSSRWVGVIWSGTSAPT